jgi:hypothetical protein
MQLPYLVPERNQDLNVAILLLIVQNLGKTQRGKYLLNNERLLIFMYLIKNPVLMTQILGKLGRETVFLSVQESYSVSSIAVNLDPLFDNDWIKSLLKHVAGLGFLKATYRKADGFLYYLTDEGGQVVDKLRGDYFDKVRLYLKALDSIKSEPTTLLNSSLNNAFKR